MIFFTLQQGYMATFIQFIAMPVMFVYHEENNMPELSQGCFWDSWCKTCWYCLNINLYAAWIFCFFFLNRWMTSEAKKDGVDADISKYDGKFLLF